MKVLMECGRVLRGLAPRRNTLAAWLAGVTMAVGLTAGPDAGPLARPATAQPQPPAPTIKWVDQTWVVFPDGAGNWALMLSMTYDKDGSVLLPVGTIAGVEKDALTTNNPPSSVAYGFTNTSIVQARIEGTLYVNAGLIAAIGVEPSLNGSMLTVRWNYAHPTEGAAFVQVGSEIGSAWEPVLVKARAHYEKTVNPTSLPEWDTTTTFLHDVAADRGRPRPTPGMRRLWRLTPGGIGILAPIIWDLLTPSATPPPPPPAPAQAPVCKQCVANCRALVEENFKHFNTRCVSSTCPPSTRVQCADCVNLERQNQLFRCNRLDSGVPSVVPFNACMVSCD